MTITLPPDLEEPLTEEARRLGTTPEDLALGSLRERFADATPSQATLFDFLSGSLAMVDGSPEAFSERSGERFSEGMLEKQRLGQL